MHYYKFNVAAWAKDTSHLTLKEEAIYLRLINYYYDTEKPIPIKTQLVLRKLRMGDESEAVKVVLDEFFVKTAKGWEHNHCNKLVADYQDRAERNRRNGKSGGRPKNNDLQKPSGLSVGKQVDTQEKPTLVNQELLTTNYKLETNSKDNRAKRFAPPTLSEATEYFGDRAKAKGVLISHTEPEKFIDFYESKNWYVGKNKMKDWKAAIRNWLSNVKPEKQDIMQQSSNSDWHKGDLGL